MEAHVIDDRMTRKSNCVFLGVRSTQPRLQRMHIGNRGPGRFTDATAALARPRLSECERSNRSTRRHEPDRRLISGCSLTITELMKLPTMTAEDARR
jgi:hypothetical protein